MELHKLLYLCKREAQLLISSDESYSLTITLLVAAASRGSPRRFWQKALSLVESNRLQVYAGITGQFPSAHGLYCEPYTCVQGKTISQINLEFLCATHGFSSVVYGYLIG